MNRTKYLIICFVIYCAPLSWSQTVEIHGKIESVNEVENIHIINKTLQKFTITNKNGEFYILAKVQDTLIVSSIQNKLKVLVVSIENILSKKIHIQLEEHINELDEVVVGKVLTGDLMKDMNAVEGKPITAKSLGIPSYQGPTKTLNERLLHEAGEFKPIQLLGILGGSIPLNPILNGLTGRTKMLKNRIELDEQEALMYAVKTRLSKDLFFDSPLEEEYIMDYFYFVSDAVNFKEICTTKTDLEILDFLKEKLIQYKSKYHELKN